MVLFSNTACITLTASRKLKTEVETSQRLARVGAAVMAQNTHRMDLILIFETIVLWYIFVLKYKKTWFVLGFELAVCRFGRFL